MIDFDFPIMVCLQRELQHLLVGGIIRTVYQPATDTLLLPIRCERQTYHLLLSAHFTHPRLHVTEQPWPHPANPSSFCMLLRKYLRGMRIQSIHHPPELPVFHLHLISGGGGPRPEVVLIGEFIEKYSNIFLVEKQTGLIIESIKHPPSPFRKIAPHLPYKMPTLRGFLHPLQASASAFVTLCHTQERQLPLWEFLHRHILGLNQWTARAVVACTGFAPLVTMGMLSNEQLQVIFATLQHLYQSQHCTPTLVLEEREKTLIPVGVSALPLPALSGITMQTTSHLSQALDRYYARQLHQQTFTRKQQVLLQATAKHITKVGKRLQTFYQTLHDAENAEQYLHLGELLKAHLGQIQRGQEAIEVVNYYDPELRLIRIPLQPALSPQENIQRYFQKYQKRLKGLAVTQQLIHHTEEQLRYLQDIRYYLSHAEEESELDALEQELIQQEISPPKSSPALKPRQISTPRCFRTPDHWEFLVGKNGKQNDLLVTRIGKGTDIWFHVRDRPGAHVLLRNPQRLTVIPDAVLRLGAQLAAYYSSARAESKVAVGYTPLKFVRKPKGALPGAVSCQRWQTLTVAPHLPAELMAVT